MLLDRMKIIFSSNISANLIIKNVDYLIILLHTNYIIKNFNN